MKRKAEKKERIVEENKNSIAKLTEDLQTAGSKHTSVSQENEVYLKL